MDILQQASESALFNKYYKGQKIIDKDISKIDFSEWKMFFNEILKKEPMTKKQFKQVRTHSIRTTAATNLYRKCHNVKTVQALLGHNSPEMTNKYVKNLNAFEELKNVMC